MRTRGAIPIGPNGGAALKSAGIASRPVLGVRRFLLRSVLLLAASIRVSAADKTAIAIGPGPRSMAPEELALAPDPNLGSQHGVILTSETEVDESIGVDRPL